MRHEYSVKTLIICVLLGAPLMLGQSKPLDQVQFTTAGSNCHHTAVEAGDQATGPSTLISKIEPNCVVPWHFHTAEEQLMVVAGSLTAEMEGSRPVELGPGGFSVMPGGHKHRMKCTAQQGCLAFVSFKGKYDITWVDRKNSYIEK